MKKLFFFVICFLAIVIAKITQEEYNSRVDDCPQCLKYEVLNYNPQANDSAIVIVNQARFTVLTPQLIRLEYSSQGQFEDRASLTFVNRYLDVPSFQHEMTDTILTITTSKLELTYDTTQYFSSQSLTIQGIGKDSSDFKGTWHYGDQENNNLMGTIRSIDQFSPITLNCSQIGDKYVDNEPVHCNYGIVSRDGWHVVNDSQNIMLTSQNDWYNGTNKDTIDNYFFGHGNNYKQAMFDFKQVAGSVPMLPRSSLGIWWSRSFPWDDTSIKQVVNEFITTDMPLDISVFDWTWHIKNAAGAYSFDTNLFPFSNETLMWMKEQDIVTMLNLHDDNGVQSYEDKFQQACAYMGLDPKKTKVIPFALCSNNTYNMMLEDVVLKPLEDEGVNFWWTDWQSGGAEGGCKNYNFNPTFMLNKLRSTDIKRRQVQGITNDTNTRRSLILGRWGGLGNHRYQVGDSGLNPGIDWSNLVYLPYFTATAANVGFGYWSHDLISKGSDSQLYIRWSQFEAVSGILRFNDRGQSNGDCAKNVYPDPPGGDSALKCSMWVPFDLPYTFAELERKALELRISLVPYLYTSMKAFFDSGVSFIRPLYYDFPDEQAAYSSLVIDGSRTQYMLGNDIMVAPITKATDSSNTMVSNFPIWLPPNSDWYEYNSGFLLKGNSTYSKLWDLSEIPMFIKAGSILGKRNVQEGQKIGSANNIYDELLLELIPGALQGQTQLYEDDGQTDAYLQGQYSIISASYIRDNSSVKITVSSSVNKAWYSQTINRNVMVKIFCSFPPTLVGYERKGKLPQYLSYSLEETPGQGYWTYSPKEIAVIIYIPQIVLEDDTYTIFANGDFRLNQQLYGLKGGIEHAQLAKQNLDPAQMTPSSHSPQDTNLIQAAEMGFTLAHYAGPKYPVGNFTSLVGNYSTLLLQAYKSIVNLTIENFISQKVKSIRQLQEDSDVFQSRLAYSLALLNSTQLYS